MTLMYTNYNKMKGLLSIWQDNDTPSVMIISHKIKSIYINGIWQIEFDDDILVLSCEEKTDTYQHEISKIVNELSHEILSRNDDISSCEKKISELSSKLGESDNNTINEEIINEISFVCEIIRMHRCKNRETLDAMRNIDISYTKTNITKLMRFTPNIKTLIGNYYYVWAPIDNTNNITTSTINEIVKTNKKTVTVDLRKHFVLISK